MRGTLPKRPEGYDHWAQFDKLEAEQQRILTDSERLECAIEVIKAFNNADDQLYREWMEKWLPETAKWYYYETGDTLPTTVEYSLSCFMMEYAAEILENKE